MAKKWIQKATASIKRRGTEGKCTPITKPGCTGRARALAKTFQGYGQKKKRKMIRFIYKQLLILMKMENHSNSTNKISLFHRLLDPNGGILDGRALGIFNATKQALQYKLERLLKRKTAVKLKILDLEDMVLYVLGKAYNPVLWVNKRVALEEKLNAIEADILVVEGLYKEYFSTEETTTSSTTKAGSTTSTSTTMHITTSSSTTNNNSTSTSSTSAHPSTTSSSTTVNASTTSTTSMALSTTSSSSTANPSTTSSSTSMNQSTTSTSSSLNPSTSSSSTSINPSTTSSSSSVNPSTSSSSTSLNPSTSTSSTTLNVSTTSSSSTIAGTTSSSTTAGELTPYEAILRGDREVPPVNSNASGNATLVFNRVTRELTLTLNYSGIIPTGAHIHKGAAGEDGYIVFPLDHTTNPIRYVSPPLTEAQIEDLKAGLYYVNIHTAAYPDGEIRAQFVRNC